jgi:hypothetical protein
LEMEMELENEEEEDDAPEDTQKNEVEWILKEGNLIDKTGRK